MDTMKKYEIDMLHGSLWEKIPRYALPLAATGVLEQLFNASDIAVVGNFTGAKGTLAVAAVGANSPIIGVVVSLFMGLSLGANVCIAYAIGHGDRNAVYRTVHASIVLAGIGGILVMIAGELFSREILKLVLVPEEVFPFALDYLKIYFLGIPAMFFYMFAAAIFRSFGDTKTPLFVLAVSGIGNILLNLFFVIALTMDVKGVAWATVLSNSISALVLLWKLAKTKRLLQTDWKGIFLDGKSVVRIMKTGLPAGIQSAVFAVANIVIQTAINSLGAEVMAASSAALTIELFVYYVLNSFGQACTTFVAQNFGAKQIDRCKKAALFCLLESSLVSGMLMSLLLFYGEFFLSLFASDTNVVILGHIRLKFVFSAYVFTLLYEIMSGYLRGFGIALIPAMLTVAGVCVTRLIYIYTVFGSHKTFTAIMLVYPISLSLTAVLIALALLVYRPARRYAFLEDRRPSTV